MFDSSLFDQSALNSIDDPAQPDRSESVPTVLNTGVPTSSPTEPNLITVAASTQPSPSKSAGLGLLAVVVGAGAGYAIKGKWGALAGALAVGGLRNGQRAIQAWRSPTGDESEAQKSGLVALLGLAAAGYAGYKAMEAPGEKPAPKRSSKRTVRMEPEETEDEIEDEPEEDEEEPNESEQT